MNYYKILNSNEEDSINKIKKEFLKLIRLYHPDKNNNNINIEYYNKTQNIIIAWNYILKNKDKIDNDINKKQYLSNRYSENIKTHNLNEILLDCPQCEYINNFNYKDFEEFLIDETLKIECFSCNFSFILDYN